MAQSSSTRHVPELAFVAGVLLSASWIAFMFVAVGPGLLLDGDALAVAVGVAAALLYPFAFYAVRYSDDPTDVLPPRPVLGGAVLVGAWVTLVGVLDGTPFGGAFVGLFVVLPPLAYAVDRGALAPDPRRTLLGTAAAGVLVLLAGLVATRPVPSAAVGLLAFLAGVAYYDRTVGRPLDPSSVLAGVAVAAGLAVAVGLGLERPTFAVLVATVTALFGGVLAVYVTATPASGGGRRRR